MHQSIVPFAVGAVPVAASTVVHPAAAIWAQLRVTAPAGEGAVAVVDDWVATSVVVCISTAGARPGRRTLAFVARVVGDIMIDGRTRRPGQRKAKCPSVSVGCGSFLLFQFTVSLFLFARKGKLIN